MDLRYCIVSKKMGVLLEFTNAGTCWTNSTVQPADGYWAAITFTQKEGEKELAKITASEGTQELLPLRLAEVTADLNPDKHGRQYRASRAALASRLLVSEVPDAPTPSST